jgi:hypothetical protein
MCTHCIVKGFENNMNDNTIVTALRNVVTENKGPQYLLLFYKRSNLNSSVY